MGFKKYVKIAILSVIINFLSIFSVILSVWSLIMLLIALFVKRNKKSSRTQKDKKLVGVMQIALIGVAIFISTVHAFISVVMFNYIVQTYLSSFQIIFILLAGLGIVVYYYFSINLFKEVLKFVKQKESA
ncbi:hypothetical protein [Amphibacillus cookii]|uniref:hypothetical protein n=1 Tax=Amphibacillus cookii TaxID=767787 RepID=UPI00195BC64D|nr:hypothetical protein [Amphibacillus cookii]MBM7540657.1 undecaprenyl pyrophosphate phosphatase UppP [Amphibacillus cookii]